MDYVEIHFHLLPGVDDGPGSVEESLSLAAAAVADGTGTVLTTPHISAGWVSDPREVPERVRELAEHLARERIPLRVLPGGELAYEMVERLSDTQLESIAHGQPDRRWLLLEGPFSGLDSHFTSAADELRERGFAVVVAHPERLAQTAGTRRALAHELSAGSAFQLTAGAFTGLFGDEARAEAGRVIHTSPRVAIASDAHGPVRMPALRQALIALSAAGETDPSRLAGTNPRALLERGLGIFEPLEEDVRPRPRARGLRANRMPARRRRSERLRPQADPGGRGRRSRSRRDRPHPGHL